MKVTIDPISTASQAETRNTANKTSSSTDRYQSDQAGEAQIADRIDDLCEHPTSPFVLVVGSEISPMRQRRILWSIRTLEGAFATHSSGQVMVRLAAPIPITGVIWLPRTGWDPDTGGSRAARRARDGGASNTGARSIAVIASSTPAGSGRPPWMKTAALPRRHGRRACPGQRPGAGHPRLVGREKRKRWMAGPSRPSPATTMGQGRGLVSGAQRAQSQAWARQSPSQRLVHNGMVFCSARNDRRRNILAHSPDCPGFPCC